MRLSKADRIGAEMQARPVALWVVLSGLALIDLVACRAVGLSFTNWLPFVAASGGIAAIGLVYGVSGRSRQIANMANGVLLWMVFSLLAAIMTYVVATQGGALRDAQFAAGDAALGFDWAAWHAFIGARPLLRVPLEIAYNTLLPQILLSAIWFAFREHDERNTELVANAMVAVLLTTALFHLVPTLGPGANSPFFRNAYIDELVALRIMSPPPIDMMHLQGLIAFPSFHAVLAVLFTYAHRRSVIFVPVALLNGLMLLSIPSEGGHYLIDLLAGIAVAGLTILVTGFAAKGEWLHWPAWSGRLSALTLRAGRDVP